MYKLLLSWRYLRTRYIALASIISVTLGVATMIVVNSVMSGFTTEMRNRIHGILSDVVLESRPMNGFPNAQWHMEEIRRVFAYHGAEHKTINAYEDGAPLTVEGVRPYSTAHPRCGTAFLLLVVLLSILVFAPLGKPALLLRLLSRIVLLPVITGIAYEVLRFTGRHADNPLIQLLIKPNLALQRLTTREPDDSMLEVSIAALRAVLEGEQRLAP